MAFEVYTNYKKNAGVKSVVFSNNKPVLEVEMNEVQEIQNNLLQTFIKNYVGDGISDLNKISYSSGALTVANNTYFTIDGHVILCTGLSINNLSAGDKVYLRAWIDTVDYDDTLKLEGNQQSNTTVENYLLDERTSVETSRRKVLKYTLARVVSGSSPTPDTGSYLLLATVNSSSSITIECPTFSKEALLNRVIMNTQMMNFNDYVAPLLDDDNCMLCDSDNKALLVDWSYE